MPLFIFFWKKSGQSKFFSKVRHFLFLKHETCFKIFNQRASKEQYLKNCTYYYYYYFKEKFY